MKTFYVIEATKGNGSTGAYLCKQEDGSAEHHEKPVTMNIYKAIKFFDAESGKRMMRLLGVTLKDFYVTEHQFTDEEIERNG